MMRRLRDQLVIASAMTLFALPILAVPGQAEAQDGQRFRVMIPDMAPTDDTRARFGERVADRLRDAIDLDFHVAMSNRDMDRAAREYNLRARDLGCTEARQLAAMVQVQLVMCGEYQREGDQLRVRASFWTVPGNEEYAVEPFLVAENNENGARDRILESFEVMVEQVRYVAFCTDAYASQNWESALGYCTQAVELAPDVQSARIALAGTYMEMDEYEKSLELFESVLAVDEWNSDVLVNAGYAATQLGETEKARGYYTRYLDINPGNTRVRGQVAFDLAQGGDLEGAMAVVQAGLAEDPEDIGLLEYYGSFAFRLARELEAFTPTSQDGDMDPEIAELYREASETLMRVVELEGAESNPMYVVNAVRAYLNLNEDQVALRTAERGLEIFPESADIWAQKGTVHNRLQQPDQAIAALQRAMDFDPEFPDVRARMGDVLVQAGRLDEGLPYLRQAIEAGERTSDQVVHMIFNDGYNSGVAGERDLAYAIRRFELAKNEFEMSTEWRQQVDFWHGYALFRATIPRQEPGTVQSARATLPEFRRARELLMAGRPYIQRNPTIIDFGPLLEGVDRYIEIQDAVIRRGGG